jgi:hypothetical protein
MNSHILQTFLIPVKRILNVASIISISTWSKPMGGPVSAHALDGSGHKPTCRIRDIVNPVGASMHARGWVLSLGWIKAHVNERWRRRFDGFHPQGPQICRCAMVKINLAPAAW